jgi:hypothetical protein
MLSFLVSSWQHICLSSTRPPASRPKNPCPIISPATPLESTLPRPTASVHPKSLTATLFPLESTLTKKPGVGCPLWLTTNPVRDLHPERPSGTSDLSACATKRVYPGEYRDEGSLFTRNFRKFRPRQKTCPTSRPPRCFRFHRSQFAGPRARLTKFRASFNVRSLSDTQKEQ